MGTLETVILVLWIIFVMIQLAVSKSFGRFIVGCIADAVLLAIVYVALHFGIKYW